MESTDPPEPNDEPRKSLTPKGEERRRVFLERGRAQVRAAVLRNELPGIEIAQLVDKADDKLTRGSFSHLWANKQEFERELVADLLDAGQYGHVDTLMQQLLPVAESGATLEQMVHAASDANFDRFCMSESWELTLTLMGVIRNETVGSMVSGALAANYAADEKDYASLYRALLIAYRRRMAPGLTVEDMAVAISAIVEGFAVRWMVDPHAARTNIEVEGDDDPWALLAVVTLAVVERFTQSLDDLV